MNFPINNKVHPKHNFYIRTAIAPQFRFILKPHSGFVYAAIDEWLVFSGLDKIETSRKSRFKTIKAELPYVQAIFDISEIHARRIGALKTGELPSARGNTAEEARTQLSAKLKEFLAAKYKEGDAETEAFMKATDYGENKKKVRTLAAGIRKRLEATPNTTVPFTDATAGPGSSPSAPVPTHNVSPAATPTPISSPSR
jgi:hypothetical protein